MLSVLLADHSLAYSQCMLQLRYEANLEPCAGRWILGPPLLFGGNVLQYKRGLAAPIAVVFAKAYQAVGWIVDFLDLGRYQAILKEMSFVKEGLLSNDTRTLVHSQNTACSSRRRK
jgi:hypothetical protein